MLGNISGVSYTQNIRKNIHINSRLQKNFFFLFLSYTPHARPNSVIYIYVCRDT